MHTIRGQTGERREYARQDEPRPWTRWDFVFDYGTDNDSDEDGEEEERESGGATEMEEDDAEDAAPEEEADVETISEGSEDGDGMAQMANKDVWLKALEGKKDFDAFELPPFNIEEYIAVRVRTPGNKKRRICSSTMSLPVAGALIPFRFR